MEVCRKLTIAGDLKLVGGDHMRGLWLVVLPGLHHLLSVPRNIKNDVFSLVALVVAAFTLKAADSQTNLVVFLTDDMGRAESSVYG